MGVERMQLELARSILFAKNMAEMVGFYRDLLGLVEVNPGTSWCAVTFSIRKAMYFRSPVSNGKCVETSERCTTL
jgi:hypothetical protein